MDETSQIGLYHRKGTLMDHRLFIIAGEKSGDLLGAHLIAALMKLVPNSRIQGIGGPEMRAEPFECIMRMEEFEIMGFSDIITSLPKLKRQFCSVRDHILETKPDAVIFIDYPGFNLKMAKSLRKHGYRGKLIQYVSPTVWAWGKKRIEQMTNTLDLLLTIYPFEKDFFKNSPLNVRYAGNPIREIIGKHHYDENWTKLFGIKNPENLVAIFPGSRKSEIQLNLPFQLKAAEILKRENASVQFAISCAHDKIMPVIHNIMGDNSLQLNKDIFLVPKAYSYELMRDCRSAIAKSGTVTLELALHKRPTVVLYKLTLLNQLIAKYFMKLNLPNYCIVNILKNETVFPELIAKGLTPQNIYHHMATLNNDSLERKRCITACEELVDILKEENASTTAAKAIEELLK